MGLLPPFLGANHTVNLAQRKFDDTVTWSETDRDLTFRPASEAAARKLTPEQIRFYNQQGYLKPFRVFSDEEILEHRHYFDRLLAKQMADGGDSYSIRRMQRFSQPIWDIITEP